jgi:LysM repeat protein
MTDRSGAPPALEPAPVALAGCPHLVSVDGPWHAAAPSRAHRCRLLVAGRPTLERQQQHCLVAEHVGCPTWLEAHGDAGRRGRTGPFVATAPVVLEGPGVGLSVESAGRRLTAPVTVVIVGAALAALVLARGPLAPGTSDAGGEAPSASPAASVAAATGGSTPAAATPAPTARPTARPTATPAAATPAPATRTYKVRSGDTLSGIAVKFGTTVDAIAALNGITNPSLIRVGQVLTIP